MAGAPISWRVAGGPADGSATIAGMQDRELYRQILGINTPWYVERVELKLAEGEAHVHLDHHDQVSWSCPECGYRVQAA